MQKMITSFKHILESNGHRNWVSFDEMIFKKRVLNDFTNLYHVDHDRIPELILWLGAFDQPTKIEKNT